MLFCNSNTVQKYVFAPHLHRHKIAKEKKIIFDLKSKIFRF